LYRLGAHQRAMPSAFRLSSRGLSSRKGNKSSGSSNPSSSASFGPKIVFVRDEWCFFWCESAQGNGIDEWIEVERGQFGCGCTCFLVGGKVNDGWSVVRSYRDAGMRPCIPRVSVDNNFTNTIELVPVHVPIQWLGLQVGPTGGAIFRALVVKKVFFRTDSWRYCQAGRKEECG
jgi:hypothetical protein